MERFSFCFFPFDVFSIIALVTQQQPSFLFLSVDVVSQGSWLGGMEGPFTRRTETKTKKHTCGFSRPLLAPLSPSSLDKVGKRGRMLRHARLQRFERRQALRRGRAARVGRRRLRPQEAGEGAHKGGAAGAGLQVVDAGAGQGLLDVAVEFLWRRGGGRGVIFDGAFVNGFTTLSPTHTHTHTRHAPRASAACRRSRPWSLLGGEGEKHTGQTQSVSFSHRSRPPLRAPLSVSLLSHPAPGRTAGRRRGRP